MENSIFNGTPEDCTNTTVRSSSSSPASDYSSDLVNFTSFIRLSAPPAPNIVTASEVTGQGLFTQIGCALCHTPTVVTGKALYPALSNIAYHPYSDFALHDMGRGLADGVTQGKAGPNEFRTTPLWGLGQRIFFLHDGRTAGLLEAIDDHASRGSEANQVIANYNSLSPSHQQDILNFLRAL